MSIETKMLQFIPSSSMTFFNVSRFCLFITVAWIALLCIFFQKGSTNSKILDLYNFQVPQRKAELLKINDKSNYQILYNTIVPEISCTNLARIGKINDGGKWICNPDSLFSLPKCTIYSLGTNNDPSFEIELQQFLGNKCKVRSLDKDEQEQGTLDQLRNANGEFMKALISSYSNQSNDQYTLKSVLKYFGDYRIDILKIDIEGAEFEISDELISVPICQILIEVHGTTAKQTLEFLQKLSKNGFYLFSYEINGAYHTASEYSFLHRRCFNDYGVNLIYGKYLS